MDLEKFISELKRRNVVKVSTAYGIASWLLIQVAVTVEEPLSLPDTFDKFVIIALLVGFPITIVATWFFEITPEGLKKTSSSGISPSAHGKGKKINTIVYIVLGLAIVFLLFDKFILNSVDQESRPAILETKSIAVLPFDDLSATQDQEWFSNGLTEELLNSLSRLSGLRVTARTSSFAFKDKDLPVPVIADSLNVRFIIEGSVRKSGNKIRITVQLIDSEKNINMWSEIYDRELKEVFEVQEDIAENIASSLNIYLDEKERNKMFAFGTRNPDAYIQYLKGNVWFDKAHSRNVPDEFLAKANEFYEEAIRLDPGFAAAWYQHQDYYAHLLVADHSRWPDSLNGDIILKRVLDDINKARKLSKTRAEAIFYELEYAMVSEDWSEVPGLFDELSKSPSHIKQMCHLGLGWSRALFILLGRGDLGIKITRYSMAMDPLRPEGYHNLAINWASLGNLDSANYWLMKEEETHDHEHAQLHLFHLVWNPQLVDTISWVQNPGPNNQLRGTETEVYAQALSGNFKAPSYFDSKLVSPHRMLFGSYVYNALGNQRKSDSIATVLDSRKLGSFSLADMLHHFGGRIPFRLSATPNLAARLKEGGIKDLENYELTHAVLDSGGL